MTDVYRALGDATRRALLDRLCGRNGQTLSELCQGLGLARQSITQHLGILEDATLVTVVRRGRERLHYLNPVPLQEIQERWISKSDRPRLDAVSTIMKRAEETAMTKRPDYVYVTYIRASAMTVWDALTSEELTAQFWGHSNVSTWEPGQPWKHVRTDGSGIADVVGRVVESERPTRLAITFEDPAGGTEARSLVTFTIEEYKEIVKLTIVHENIPTPEDADAAALGWAAVGSNLKSLLETGNTLPQAPWDMHAQVRDAQMRGRN
ncbi:ArsR/SmtB family transcription factor [Arthrobacter dokdonensis]|uniref:ArsR/SmtB family transcription factor n=1 Tax=Arthrobacter dokdonellae TaxID=2211210 RepID=UPI000DE58BD6|nr:SRPBCC domain-containing protein [Arthrobacter dokdonellae]